MEVAPHGLDTLIKFSTEHRGKWSDHVGNKHVLDLANAEWKRINQNHGWVARIQHVIQHVLPAVHGVSEKWNLMAAYEPHKVHKDTIEGTRPSVHAWGARKGQA